MQDTTNTVLTPQGFQSQATGGTSTTPEPNTSALPKAAASSVPQALPAAPSNNFGTMTPQQQQNRADLAAYKESPQATGFTASMPSITSDTVQQSHDNSQPFTDGDTLQSARALVDSTRADVTTAQNGVNAMNDKYSDFYNNPNNNDVNFYNNQLSSQGLTGTNGLYAQQAQLQGQVQSLKEQQAQSYNTALDKLGDFASKGVVDAATKQMQDNLQRQIDSVNAQLATVDAQVAQRTNIADKLLSANQYDENKDLQIISAQTGIAKDTLSNATTLYRDAVTAFNGDRAAAKSAIATLISNVPGIAQKLADPANAQALQDLNNGNWTPAVMNLVGQTYKDIQAQDRLTQLAIAQQNASSMAGYRGVMAGVAQYNAGLGSAASQQAQSEFSNILSSNQLPDGTSYISQDDIKQLPKGLQNQIVQYANAQGVKILTPTDQKAYTNIISAQQNLKDLSNVLSQLKLPTNIFGRVASAANYKLNKYLQYNGQLAAYDTFKTAALPILIALAGEGSSGRAVGFLKNIQETIPQPTDTVATAQSKLQNLNSMLLNAKNVINPDNTPGAKFSSAITKTTGSDGYISPQDWSTFKNAWIQRGGSESEFVNNYRAFANPADPQDYEGIK